MKLTNLIALVIVFLVSQNVFGKGESSELKTKSKKIKTEKTIKKKKLGVDQSDFMPSANSFGLIASYRLTYNQLEQVEYKTVNHALALAGTYSFDKHWSAYTSIAFSHETYNDRLFKENDSDQFHQLSDINIGAVYSKMKPLSFIRRSSNTLNIALPTSERARFDKSIGSVSLTNFMGSYSWKKFSLFNRVVANYLWNTQRFSVTTDLVNRDWVLANSFGINYLPFRGAGIRASLNANYVNYLNGVANSGFGNNLTIFGNVSGFQLWLSYLNQAYPENDRLDPLLFDRYRRLWSGGVTYAF